MKKESLEVLGKLHDAAVDVAQRELVQHMAATSEAMARLRQEQSRLEAERHARGLADDTERERAGRQGLNAGDLQRLDAYCGESRRREAELIQRAEQARQRADAALRGEAHAVERLKDKTGEQVLGRKLRGREAERQRAQTERLQDEEVLDAWSGRRG